MVLYNFKDIAPVPSSKDFIDIILSKTQRKTPTVVHKGYNISRIRRFYMRKIKFTQENYHERISLILDEFPRLDDIHPFYADLINILYSRDHYKLALGQINTAKSLIDNIGKDYLKLIKFGDSLYRCKELKRAALGRMCTVVSKLGASLQYLEQVRQHLSRLPSINTSTRTLLITGVPNVGKSSFMNKVSNANVEVQPYAFTTKSLYVGHFDYLYTPWQIIDTPGLLDHPLEDRNTIEMQAITALAHIHSTVLYIIDPSEQCGYSLHQQVSLFNSIKPLFANKALLVVANKADLKKLSDLSSEDQALVQGMIADRPDARIIEMSNMTDDNIIQVRDEACRMIRERNIERKLQSSKINEIANRIQITAPAKRDNKERGVSIPQSVLDARAARRAEQEAMMSEMQGLEALVSKSRTNNNSSSSAKPRRKTERDLELENGGPGIYNIDLRKNHLLSNPDWKYDIMPEIMDGKNVADFYDENIAQRLAELEAEELAIIEAEGLKDGMDEVDSDYDSEYEANKELIKKVADAKAVHIAAQNLRKSNNKPVIPRSRKAKSLQAVEQTLTEQGVDTSKLMERARSKSKTRPTYLGKRGRRGSNDDTNMADDHNAMMDDQPTGRGRSRSVSRAASSARDPSLPRAGETELEAKLRSRSKSRTGREDQVPRKPEPSPFRNVRQKLQAEKLSKTVQRARNRDARQGEADRHFYDEKPKHLYSGKRGIGSTDRR